MKVESSSINIVLVGRFTPDKFLPNRLAESKLISPKIAESARYLVLIPGVQVQFSFEWGELVVTPERFHITTTEAPYVRICDFVIKAVADLNPDALVNAFGVNRDSHVDLGSIEARNELGVRLAPPMSWGMWGEEILKSMRQPSAAMDKQGGVVLIQMRLPFSENGISGWLDVSALPSGVIANNTGVHLRANHHHQAAPPSDSDGKKIAENNPEITQRMLAQLGQRFEASIAGSEKVFDGLFTK